MERELEYLNGFLTYVSVKQMDIQKCLVNFDHADPMNPSLYTTSRHPMDVEQLRKDKLSNVRVRDGRGATYAGRLTLSTRESEDITVIKTLSPKEEMVV